MKKLFMSTLLLVTLFTSVFAAPNIAEPSRFDPASFFADTGRLATLNSSGVTQDTVVVLGYSQPKYIYDYKSVFLLADITVTTPAAGVFTCAVTDICTDAAHGFTTGLKGQGSTTTTLPAGLSTSTDYFVIRLSADTYSLATSYANAIAGTAINITDTGTGTHTFTPTSIAGGTVSLQGSTNDSVYVDIGSTTAVTATSKASWNISDTYYPYVRLKYVNTAGTFTSNAYWSGKSRP